MPSPPSPDTFILFFRLRGDLAMLCFPVFLGLIHACIRPRGGFLTAKPSQQDRKQRYSGLVGVFVKKNRCVCLCVCGVEGRSVSGCSSGNRAGRIWQRVQELSSLSTTSGDVFLFFFVVCGVFFLLFLFVSLFFFSRGWSQRSPLPPPHPLPSLATPQDS